MLCNIRLNARLAAALRSALCFFLILVLLFFLVARCFAVVASASIIVPVVLAAMGAFGVGTLVNGMTAAEITSWLGSELDSWAASLSDTVDNLIPLSGISTNPLGSLVLLPATALKVVTFVRWLLTKYNVSAGGSPQVAYSNSAFTACPAVTLGKTQIVNAGYSVCRWGSSYDVFAASNTADTYMFFYNYAGRLALVACCPTSGARAGIAGSFISTVETRGLNTRYNSQFYYGEIYDASSFNSPTIPYFSTLDAGLAAVGSFLTNGSSSLTLVPEGAIDYPDYTGDDENEMPYVVDWGGVPGMTLDDAADDIMERVEDNALTTSGDTALDPDNTVWPDIVSAPMVQGLDDVFPFCIPFDIYHFLQALSAAPTAPRFEIPFNIPNLINYTMVIDLSSFDTVAQIFRTMELLAFCIGLAFVTRRLIRG